MISGQCCRIYITSDLDYSYQINHSSTSKSQTLKPSVITLTLPRAQSRWQQSTVECPDATSNQVAPHHSTLFPRATFSSTYLPDQQQPSHYLRTQPHPSTFTSPAPIQSAVGNGEKMSRMGNLLRQFNKEYFRW